MKILLILLLLKTEEVMFELLTQQLPDEPEIEISDMPEGLYEEKKCCSLEEN